MHLPKLQNKVLLDPEKTYFKHKGDFLLESGEKLKDIEIAYTTFGKLNKAKDNVVWVFHALTGNPSPNEWWPDLVGNEKLINPSEHFIVCANVIGGCYGSTGPASINPISNKPYLSSFPLITIRDIIKAHKLLFNHLGLEKIFLGIGGSLGGQQLLEWAAAEPYVFENIVPIATNAQHSAWGIAFNETQRMALVADSTFNNGSVEGGKKGLEAARAIAMLSYRTHTIYNQQQTDYEPGLDNFRASSYQKYQGLKLSNRFNAHSYFILSKAMDSHNISRGRGSLKQTLSAIKSRALVIGIESDILFPLHEQKFVAEHIPGAYLESFCSIYGHDGFLAEPKKLNDLIKIFLEQ